MGSPAAETGRRAMKHRSPVTISRGFWTGKFEITQGEWRRVMGELPARKPSAEFGLGDDIPVYWVSFNDAEAFCRAADGTRTTLGRAAGGLGVPAPDRSAVGIRLPRRHDDRDVVRRATGPAPGEFQGRNR